MPGNYILVGFGAMPQMLPIDSPNITPANRRGFHLHQNLTVTRFWNGESVILYPAPAGQNDTFHRFLRYVFDFFRVLGNRALA